MDEMVVVIDYGGQYNQLIARKVREQGVYAELLPYSASIDEVRAKNPVGIIFTGGPGSVTDSEAPGLIPGILDLGVPVLGICYGAQLLASACGGSVRSSEKREYGNAQLQYDTATPLFAGLPAVSSAWMSHSDHIDRLPAGFDVTASTPSAAVAAFEDVPRKLYGVQFHPEVEDTPEGPAILHNFLYGICEAKGGWTMESYAKKAIDSIQQTVGEDGRVLLALSGGVDSSVCAVLLNKAIGDRLTCVFVNTGLMRKGEPEQVEEVFREQFHVNLVHVDATERFLGKLAGVTDPEQKRKIIGEEFIRVFEEEAKKVGSVEYLAQGTIYPDIIESGAGDAALIKSHHNVGGLPDVIDFKGIIEPLRDLFKDEVRVLGTQLGLPEHMVWRQPFPGPGLAIRVIGEVTKEKLAIVREADAIFREEIESAELGRKIWQYFAVLTNLQSVGVMGDARTYDYAIALRAVMSVDAMTADWARIPDPVLERASSRIVNEVPHVNRILYDITTKPPATIEYE